MKIYEAFKKNMLYEKLLTQTKNNNIAHSMLFLCVDNFSCTQFSYLIANLLICKNFCCETCPDCQKAKSQTHPDILVYPKNGADFSVADSADIYDNIQIKPMLASKKVIVVNNIDNGTEQAQNKLLKIIEEPPKNVYFIFNATNENGILKTIMSRVQKMYIPSFNASEIQEIFSDITNKNKYDFSGTNINLQEITAKCQNLEYENYLPNENCFLGQVLNSFNENNLKNVAFVKNFISNCKKSTNVLDYISYFNKENFVDLLFVFSRQYREKLLNQINNPAQQDDYSVYALVEILKYLNHCKKVYESNVSVSALSENLLLKIMELKNLWKQNI